MVDFSANGTGILRRISMSSFDMRSHTAILIASTALLLAGCGLNTGPRQTTAVPAQPHGLRAAPPAAIERTAQVAPDVYFNFNSHAIPRLEQKKLANIASGLQGILRDFPDVIIVIEGHCDDRGMAQYNEELGLQRANAVKQALLSRGFPDDRLRTASFSHRMPLCVTPDDRCRQKNRRVHFRAAQPLPEYSASK
jgi:peptidoglycan-associated lipoprotein